MRPLTIFILFILLGTQLYSQEKKNNFRLSGIAAHYIGNEEYELIGSYPGYYNFPVDPGFEILYLIQLSKSLEIGTGFNYQKGRVASYMSGLRRFEFYEISIPFILQKDFPFNEKRGCFLAMGFYGGKTFFQKAESPNSASSWHEWPNLEDLENYSDNVCFVDIYFDVGYSMQFAKRVELALAPFVKYRVNPTWLNYHQNKIHYGIKLN